MKVKTREDEGGSERAMPESATLRLLQLGGGTTLGAILGFYKNTKDSLVQNVAFQEKFKDSIVQLKERSLHHLASKTFSNKSFFLCLVLPNKILDKKPKKLLSFS